MRKTKKRKHSHTTRTTTEPPDAPRGNLNTGNSQYAELMALVKRERPQSQSHQ